MRTLLKDRLARLRSAVSHALGTRRPRDKKLAAEEALRESEERYRSLFEGVPVGLYRSTPSGQLLDANPAMVRMLGYPDRESVLAMNAADLYVDPSERQVWTKPLEQQGVLEHHENRLRQYDGAIIWVRATSSVVRNAEGRVQHYEGALEDITEARRAQDQIERQLTTITELYASAQKLSQSLDLNQLADYVVSTAVRTFGATIAWVGRAESDGTLRILAHFPAEADYVRWIPVRWDDEEPGRSPSARALRTGFPVVMDFTAADPGLPAERATAALHAGVRSGATFPLITRDKPLGVLMMHSDRSDFFTPERTEFFQTFANQAAAALENARLFEETETRFRQFQALRNVDIAISSSLDLRVTLFVILDQLTTHLGADAADLLFFDPHTQTLRYATNRGFRRNAPLGGDLRLGEGHAGRAALERRTINVPNLAEGMADFPRSARLLEEEFVAYYAIPLIAKGQIKGVLEIFHRGPLNPTLDWMGFLEALAGQAAIAIDNSTLFDGLQRANLELVMAYDTTLEGWSRALDLRDRETEGHTLRVTEITVQLARILNVSDEDLVHIRRGALLHDIGKMGIPDSILLKPGPLTDEEWVIMKKHPVYAYELLFPIAYLRPALDIPYCHHERWDGTGYPRGLSGERVPLAARIFSVVDVWDALRSDRPYRKQWSEERVQQYLRGEAGKQFDPGIVEPFLKMQS